MRKVLLFLFLLSPLLSVAQEHGKFTFSGFLETYYSYDFNQPADHLRPEFLYNFKRHNEFSVNLALLQASYQEDNIRATLGLMVGNYAQFNLADEPQWAQLVYEASVGFKLLDKLWLDVGIMPSHIGFESAIGADCWHLSRSLLAENSPYFLTGARLSYAWSEELDFTLWATNGWQNVQRQSRNQGVGLGFAANYRPVSNLEIHYANYFGNEGVNPASELRFFNNFYTQYSPGKWGATIGFDYGVQSSVFSQINHWIGLTASLRRDLGEKFKLAGRAEYYADQQAIILDQGMRISGLSTNLDYAIHPRGLVRIELRQFFGDDSYFELPGAKFSYGNTALTTSFSISF